MDGFTHIRVEEGNHKEPTKIPHMHINNIEEQSLVSVCTRVQQTLDPYTTVILIGRRRTTLCYTLTLPHGDLCPVCLGSRHRFLSKQ